MNTGACVCVKASEIFMNSTKVKATNKYNGISLCTSPADGSGVCGSSKGLSGSLYGSGLCVRTLTLNPFPNKPWFVRVCSTSLLKTLWEKEKLLVTCLQYKSFENTVGKGKIARNEHYFLFPQCFLPAWKTFCHFLSNLKLSSANCLSLKFVV